LLFTTKTNVYIDGFNLYYGCLEDTQHPGRELANLQQDARMSELDDDGTYIYNTYSSATWNPRRAVANLLKHGVRFSDAKKATP
jgi:hypothetical protein